MKTPRFVQWSILLVLSMVLGACFSEPAEDNQLEDPIPDASIADPDATASNNDDETDAENGSSLPNDADPNHSSPSDTGSADTNASDPAPDAEDPTEDASDTDDDVETNAGDDVEDDPDTDTGDDPPDADEPFEPGPCDGDSFTEAFEAHAVEETSYPTDIHSAPTPDNGAVIAWQEFAQIHVVRVGGDGSIIAEQTIEGQQIYGLATNDESYALLAFRSPDILALVVHDFDGTEVQDKTIIGDVDQSVQGSTWFGNLIRDGRITWTGEEWAAYYTVQELRSDGVAHYGDQLQTFDADGTQKEMIWSWGCSHSMEVQISHNGERLGPVCSSDCFPQKGVHFNHQSVFIYPDEEGSNCAGAYGTSLGASIPIEDEGFWIVFTATDDRDSHDAAVVKITGFSDKGPIQWLTENDVNAIDLNGAQLGDEIVVAFNEGGDNHFYLLDGDDGATLEGPQAIEDANLSGVRNFFVYSNGDIGWAQSNDQGIELARLQHCDGD